MTLPQATDSYNAAIQECDRLIQHFDRHAKKHKRTFVRYKYLSIALTSAVTVISALEGIYRFEIFWLWLVPVVSGLAAFCTTMVHATNSRELWLRARHAQLKALFRAHDGTVDARTRAMGDGGRSSKGHLAPFLSEGHHHNLCCKC